MSFFIDNVPDFSVEDSCGPTSFIPISDDKSTDSTSHEDDQEDDEEYLEEDIFDEETYSRGRSRSHSMHANDNGPVVPVDPFNIPKPKLQPLVDVIDIRSGPLQEREVLALQKGLEMATSPRDERQLLEEEEERAALAEEAKKNYNIHSSPISDARLRKLKILMLGDSGVGKTSLVNRYTKDDFNHTLVGTVGVDFKCKRVDVDGELVNLQIWDTAGQEHFHRITQAYYGGSQAIMVVFDISEQKTLDSVSYWMQCIVTHASEAVPIVLVGNKKDLRDSEKGAQCVPSSAGAAAAAKATEIARKRVKQLANDMAIQYYETSAKTAENVEEAYLALLRCILAKSSNAQADVSDRSHVSRPFGGSLLKADKNKDSTEKKMAGGKSRSWLGWLGV